MPNRARPFPPSTNAGVAESEEAGSDPCAQQCAGGECRIKGTSFRCECAPGFELAADGKSCNEIDECATAECPEVYPCLETEPPGYTCAGQWADWPMPENESTASVKPSLDWTTIPGVVVDAVTGLWWQRGFDQRELIWTEAREECRTLNLAGADDWRMPSFVELMSIVDRTAYQPAIDSIAFPDTPGSFFWTSTAIASATESDHYGVGFHDGSATPYSDAAASLVRCVRTGRRPAAGTPKLRYRFNSGSWTVTDRRTGLEWETPIDLFSGTFPEAVAHCGDIGMRLPTVNELITTMDFGRTDILTDASVFGESKGSPYWTSTPFESNKLSADCTPGKCGWTVNFTTGGVYRDGGKTPEYPYVGNVRCVR